MPKFKVTIEESVSEDHVAVASVIPHLFAIVKELEKHGWKWQDGAFSVQRQADPGWSTIIWERNDATT